MFDRWKNKQTDETINKKTRSVARYGNCTFASRPHCGFSCAPSAAVRSDDGDGGIARFNRYARLWRWRWWCYRPVRQPAIEWGSERASEHQHRHHLRRHHHHYYSADDGPIRSISAVPLCKCPSGGPDADPPRSKPNRRRRLRPRTTVAASAVIACRREIQKNYITVFHLSPGLRPFTEPIWRRRFSR